MVIIWTRYSEQKAESTHPVDDTGRVDVFETAKDLIDQELYMFLVKSLRLDDVVEIWAHFMIDEIDILERDEVRRRRKQVQ